MSHPYDEQRQEAFWKLGVVEANGNRTLSGLWQPKFPIRRSDVFITAGSCFAQHIGRALVRKRFKWIDAEPAPNWLSAAQAKANGYGIYSFRTGNIYSTALLRQWIDWALDGPPGTAEVWEEESGFIDPYRPKIEQQPFASLTELERLRQQTLDAIVKAVKEASIFVFTLGQTETWINRETGHAYPMCPGTIAGTFDAKRHVLRRMRYPDVVADMNHVIARLAEVNSGLKFLLTVSPIPLTATATDEHVLVASTYSKSLLRAAATDLRDSHDNVDYFPSFEIIATHPARGRFFEDNQRTVTHTGIQIVMRHLIAGITGRDLRTENTDQEKASGLTNGAVPASQPATKADKPNTAQIYEHENSDLVCEEMALEAFAQPRSS
ncbi:MAG: GSCFA domain-containing protein [Kiloniellales bacterium]